MDTRATQKRLKDADTLSDEQLKIIIPELANVEMTDDERIEIIILPARNNH